LAHPNDGFITRENGRKVRTKQLISQRQKPHTGAGRLKMRDWKIEHKNAVTVATNLP